MIADQAQNTAWQLRQTIRSRLDVGREPQLTISLPLERAWNQTETNRIRLRTLTDRAREDAERRGVDAGTIQQLLRPAQRVLETELSRHVSSDGILIHAAPDSDFACRLPFSPTAAQFVDARLHIRSIWRHFEPDGRFYVLALSAGGAALFRASRYDMEAVDLGEEVPTTLSETLKYDVHTRSVRFHTETPPQGGGGATGRPAIFYGHEDAGDRSYVKEGLLRFFQALDNGVRAVLDEEKTPAPLVLAGPDHLCGLYGKANQYGHVVPDAVDGLYTDWQTMDWDAGELHRRAWPLVQPHLEIDRTAARDRILARPEQTVGNVGAAALAAAEGRIDTLFIPEASVVWGVFDEAAHSVAVTGPEDEAATELMNFTASRTLTTGGTVYVVDTPDVPGDLPVAGLLRY
jgi:hypothetical protein